LSPTYLKIYLKKRILNEFGLCMKQCWLFSKNSVGFPSNLTLAFGIVELDFFGIPIFAENVIYAYRKLFVFLI
jgi:hypothetical protein